MYKEEFKKIFKTWVMPVAILVLAALVTFLCVSFAQEFDFGATYRKYGISSYSDSGELYELIEETKESIESMEYTIENTDYADSDDKAKAESNLAELKLQLNVYNYLYEYDVAYTDYNDYCGIRGKLDDNAFCAFTWLIQICSFALPLVTGVIAAIMMPMDFHNGTYKYLYSSSTPRKKFIWTRYLTWLTCAVGLSLVLCLACSLLALMYGSASGVIVFATSSSAFGLNYFGTVMLETASVLLKVITYGTVVFGISMLARNVVLPIVAGVALNSGAIALSICCSVEGSHPFLYVLTNGITGAFSFQAYGTFSVASNVTILLTVLVLILVAVIAFVAGYVRLNHRNLY